MADLLPISTRVTHFDGGPCTHGKGTIIGYNNVAGSNPFKFISEVEHASKKVQDVFVQGSVAGAYDSTRCPYIVKWDASEKFPEGYTDVYEPSSINVLIDKET